MVLAACVGIILLRIYTVLGLQFSGYEEPSAESAFVHLTGWSLPANGIIEGYRNTTTEWPGDGECQINVNVSPKTLKNLMSLPGFTWNTWPPDDMLIGQAHGLPDFNATHFRAEHVDPNDDWHRGKIIMVNTSTGKICAYAWKN